MMIRPLGSLLLSLPVAAALTLGAAQAQTSDARTKSPKEPVTEQGTGPFGSLMSLFLHEAQAQSINPNRIESKDLPPPAVAMPDGGASPLGSQVGHQFGDSGASVLTPTRPNTALKDDSEAMRPPGAIGTGPGVAPPPVPASTVMTLPPEDQPEQGQPKELPPNLKKQLVDYVTKEPAGTIIVDTPNTYLYLVLGGGKALRYGIGVGREGFTWAGTERVSRMKEWPDWFPPAEMIERQPYLPRMMAGGPGNPLGARALYLGKTLYRIHGTNQPSTIGQTVSSGCIRLLNDDIEDLFSRVQVGTRVVVLPGKAPETVANAMPPAAANPMAPPSANAAPAMNAPLNTLPQAGATAATGPTPPPVR
jgi:lipoprotein-anchoring transpeptidase ErfK/SrfK